MDFLILLAGFVDRLDPQIGVVLDYFRDGRVPLRLSAALAAVASLLLAALLGWTLLAGCRIRILHRRIRRDGAARDFSAIDAALSASILGRAWTEYRRCLIETGDGVLYPRRPQEYLGLHALPAGAFPARFFAAAHGYFIGVGLLLTFVGLVAALKFAAGGVASPDIAVAKQALNGLLSAASFKFMTSIAGLGCALVLSAATRTATSLIEGSVYGLAGELERLMTPLVAERLAYEQLAATRAQCARLEQLTTAAPAAGADAERLERVLGGFLAQFRTTAATEIDGVAETLGRSGEALAEQLGVAAARMSDAAAVTQQSMARAAKEAGDDLARGIAAANDQLLAGSEAIVQRLADLCAGLTRLNAELQPQIAGMREVGASLVAAREALDDSAETWQRAAQPVVNSAAASQAVAAELNQVAVHVSDVQRDMTATARALARLSENTVAVWDNYRGRFEKVDDDLQAVFDRLQGGTRAFGKEVMEFVGRLDHSLVQSMQALSVGTEELREVAELLVTGVQAKAA